MWVRWVFLQRDCGDIDISPLRNDAGAIMSPSLDRPTPCASRGLLRQRVDPESEAVARLASKRSTRSPNRTQTLKSQSEE